MSESVNPLTRHLLRAASNVIRFRALPASTWCYPGWLPAGQNRGTGLLEAVRLPLGLYLPKTWASLWATKEMLRKELAEITGLRRQVPYGYLLTGLAVNDGWQNHTSGQHLPTHTGKTLPFSNTTNKSSV
jgi:hypothetical protein